jgi:uroporphyrinogen-III decarboxylase
MMILIGSAPELARHAARRYLQNAKTHLRELVALGVDAVWIEEYFTDQISPETFQELNVPLMKEYVGAIRASGLKSIYYYCGNPMDRLEPLIAVGADALHFEESKKNFVIDIDDVVAAVEGRCTVFGNLDSIGILQNGSDDDLSAEIERQLRAGWRNRGRFILSTGSPITPATSVERVRRYTDAARAIGRMS